MKLTSQVEEEISAVSPDRFARVFDFQTSSDSHYVSIFSTFPADNHDGYRIIFLSLSTFDNEDKISPGEQKYVLHFMLSMFSKKP